MFEQQVRRNLMDSVSSLRLCVLRGGLRTVCKPRGTPEVEGGTRTTGTQPLSWSSDKAVTGFKVNYAGGEFIVNKENPR